MPHVDFVHLHCHTQFSLLDSTCKIKDLIKRAVELKMPAIAMTDNGNLFGALEFYSEAMKQGIKPIIGMSAYIAPGSRFEKQSHGIKEASFHLTLLVRNEQGYKNLMKLSSIGYTEGFYYRPRIDKEILAEHSEGLIGMSGGLKGEIPHSILHEQMDEAKKALQEFIAIFGKENFYLELMDHELEPEKKLVKTYLELSKEFGVGVVATNDVHYINRKDAMAHDALICIGTGATIADERRFRYEGDQYYLKSAAEMQQLFKDYPDTLKNTQEIANRCNLELEFGQFHLPPFKAPEGVKNFDYLEQLCREFLVKRLKMEMSEIYEKRLVYELGVINKMGYVNYFLIVWDFIHYAKKNGIPVGPGRGSAAGSLVAYALSITDIDPIVHGLIFERFLNPERVSMPDIDIDFCYERRDEVIEYVRRFYGYENVAQIITFGTMAAKAAVRDVSRVMGFTYADADRIAKLIPTELNITIKSAIEKEPKLKELIATDARVSQLIDTSMALEGIARHCSTHAAGVVISDKPLTEYVALFKTGEQISTQFGMKDVEKIGLLKMDFLGLKTLTMISKAMKVIEKNKGIQIDLENLPLDDAKTYELLARAEAAGVFQLESSGMRDLLKKMKPTKFDHIVAFARSLSSWTFG
jgi:DNA polymerase-3 subunit alpha